MTSSPFPSHPTGHSVFPNPAVRQSSSHSMRRLSRVRDDSTPDVDDSPGIQSRIRIRLPSEDSTFGTIVQVAPEANGDESLQAAKGLTCGGVAKVIPRSRLRRSHLLNKRGARS